MITSNFWLFIFQIAFILNKDIFILLFFYIFLLFAQSANTKRNARYASFPTLNRCFTQGSVP